MQDCPGGSQEAGMTTATESPVMTPEQAARYLTVGVKTLKNYYRAWKIPATRAGRQLRFYRADLDAYLQRGCR